MTAVPDRDPPALVRDSVEADLAAIAAIYRHHVTTGLGSFEEAAPDLEEIARRRRLILDQGLPYLAAEVDGAVRGFAYAALYRTRSAYRPGARTECRVRQPPHAPFVVGGCDGFDSRCRDVRIVYLLSSGVIG